MTAPKRIQLRRTKGWRKPEGAVVVARPSRWGNPYRVIGSSVVGPGRPIEGGELRVYSSHSSVAGAVEHAIELFRCDVDCAARSKLTTASIVATLAGCDLACWCKPGAPCHADVLLEIANGDGPA